MPRIQQLSPNVINKIAAGEVIERPASVVKELLENSVDALSTRIEVDVAAGGAELIRIVDDGEGIHPDDILLSVASHATSKITNADDLFRVQTLGFRGEALASIAEVSHFRIRTRCPDREDGVELEVRGGEIDRPRPCGCPVGTTIEIRDLFLNTPVRRKFMKTAATELSHICEQFTRIALANPRLHLVLRHNQKQVYELPATDRLLDRLRLFYGGDLVDKLIWVESELNGIRIWGYVAHPSQSKSTRKGQYLFLNGRWIQDRSLQHALGEAYRGLLMVGRYPIAFLFLEMPADLVDVNVHPTKSEVRFRDSQPLYRQLLSTLRTRFLGMNLDSEFKVTRNEAAEKEAAKRAPVDEQRQLSLEQDLVDWAKTQIASWKPMLRESSSGQIAARPGSPVPPRTPDFVPFPDLPPSAAKIARENTVQESDGFSTLPPQATADGIALPENGYTGETAVPHDAGIPTAENDAALPAGTQNGSESAPPAASTLKEIPYTQLRAMQIHDCYLVAETDEGLTVIDQHALHERVLYEHFRARVLTGAVESQRLLIPETIELTPAETALLLEHQELLGQLGLGIEEFGGSTLLLNSYPVMLSRSNLTQLVRDVAEQLAGSGQAPSRRDLLDELLHMMSCKAAIKAGQPLSDEEIQSLLAQRHLIDDAHHCPHGRPTALVLSRAELDRQFGRLG